jgi:oligopeptide/dipeptide ABC transporter ATP-binding protein
MPPGSVSVPAGSARKQRTALGGELPDPAALAGGCRFHPRCPKRFEPCDQVDPELYPAGEPAHEAVCLLLRGDASSESRSDIA